MAKVKVYTSEKFVREMRYSSEHVQGHLEVYIDLTKLAQYAETAFRNKQGRFIRGPFEVRAVKDLENGELQEAEKRRGRDVKYYDALEKERIAQDVAIAAAIAERDRLQEKKEAHFTTNHGEMYT